MGTPVSDKKPNDSGQQPGTPVAKAKANGTTPTVTARRPLSKDEYARTTKQSPDATSVIPAVRDDQPAPPSTNGKAEIDDRPTQTLKAVPAAAEPVTQEQPAVKPEAKKPDDKPAAKQNGQPAKQKDKKSGKPQGPSAKNGAVAAGAAAGAAVSAPAAAKPAAPTAAAPAAPAPTAPKPSAPAAPEKSAPSKPVLKRPDPKNKKPKPTAQPSTPAAQPDGATTRSARLKLKHIEPWSVTKMAFVVSVALMVVSVVAVTVFWLVLQITGVWGALNDSVSNVLADDASGFDVTDYLGFGRVVGLTLLVSALNVIFMTALATIAAHLYNLASGILGGVEVTFGERQ